MATNKDKLTIKNAIQEMEKKHGAGIITKLTSEKDKVSDVIPTGSISLDYALGIKGIPRGRIIEIYGPESSGKTTLSLSIIAEAQKKGIKCAFVDAEHSLNADHAMKMNVDMKELYVSQPDCGEQALDVVETFVKTHEIGLIVVDSVSALTPTAEIDGQMGAIHVGLQARMMSQALRKLTAITSRAKTTIIFINQIRMKIGQSWGNPETTSGGNALKFYSSMRIEVRRAAKLKKGDDIVGNRVKVIIAKNKLAAPFKQTEFDILYDEGISKTDDILNFCIKTGIIKKEGITLYFEKEKLGAGFDKAKQFLKDNPQILETIINKIYEI